MKSFGLLPNAEGTPYTIPALRIYSDKYIMDSLKIAKELELRYPSPSLYLDSPILPKVMDIIPNILETMRGALMPKIPPTLLNPSSAEYFEETRAKRFGKPLAQLEKENSGDTAWLEVTPVLNELGHILRAEGGPFALGKTVSYADLVIVGALQFIKRIGEDLFERAMRIEPALKKLYDASEGWLERDDH
ncbi:hypothetical protein MMC28_011517 [Mycoblastus sanguinarius]|nr:hypothetical protein [Mycoblastus sanguinarius]